MAEAPTPVTQEALQKHREEILASVEGTVTNLRNEVERANAAAAEARAKLAEAQAPAAPERRSPEDLQRLVDEGVLTSAKMQEILVQQGIADAETRVRQEVRSELAQSQRAEAIGREIAAYKEAEPKILLAGSPERDRVAKEYDGLRQLGYPDDASTELLALRAAFGPPRKLKEKTAEHAPSHEDTGSPGGGSEAGGGNAEALPSGAPQGISKRLAAYYEDRIKQGVYPGGWKNEQLVKELEIAKRKS